MKDFLNFIREQGIVGLAVGFILGGAVSKTVTSLVDNIINPVIGVMIGKVNLADKVFKIDSIAIKYGAFISSIVDFLIVAFVVYLGVKILNVNKLDKPKV